MYSFGNQEKKVLKVLWLYDVMTVLLEETCIIVLGKRESRGIWVAQ